MDHRIGEVVTQFGHLFLFGNEAQQLDDDDGEEAQDNGADQEERTQLAGQFGVGIIERSL